MSWECCKIQEIWILCPGIQAALVGNYVQYTTEGLGDWNFNDREANLFEMWPFLYIHVHTLCHNEMANTHLMTFTFLKFEVASSGFKKAR